MTIDQMRAILGLDESVSDADVVAAYVAYLEGMTQPAEPLTVAQVRQHLRLDDDQTDEDGELATMITAARRALERVTNRSIVGGTRTAVFGGFPRYPWVITGTLPIQQQLIMGLPGGTVSAINGIQYLDTDGTLQTLDSASYSLDSAISPAALGPVDVWPFALDRPDAVRVNYTLSPLSDEDMMVVGQAMKLLIGHWYRNRESVAVDVRGVPVELPLSVTWLIHPLRIAPFR